MSKKELISALHQFKLSFRDCVMSLDKLVENTSSWDEYMPLMSKNLNDALLLETELCNYCSKFPDKSEVAKARVKKVGNFYKINYKNISDRIKAYRNEN